MDSPYLPVLPLTFSSHATAVWKAGVSTKSYGIFWEGIKTGKNNPFWHSLCITV